MSDVVLNPLSLGAPHGGGAPLGIAATVSDPPQALRNLAEGHILQGTVAGTDAHGQLLVRTRFGLLAVQTAQKIPVGSQLILEVRSTGPRVHVLILQVRSAGVAALQPSGHAGAPTHALGINPLPDVVSVGQSLRAVVQRPPPGTAGPLPGPLSGPLSNPLPPGSELTLRLTAVGVPPAAPIAGSSAQGAPPAGPQPPMAPGLSPAIGGSPGAAAPAPQAGAAPPGPSGAEVVATLERSGRQVAALAQLGRAASPAAAPPGTGPAANTGASQNTTAGPVATGTAGAGLRALAATAGEPPPARFTGQVTAVSNGGNPIVQTPLGTLSLSLRTPIPVGSSLAFEMLAITPAKPGDAPAARPAPWPTLAAALDSLAADPALKAQLLPRLFPQTGPRLAAGLLLFLSALKGGSVEGWLGALAGQLESNRRGPNLDALRGSLAGLSRTVEGSGGEWRLFLIPLLHDGNLEALRLYLRDHHDEDDAEDGKQRKPRATRFIIDVELTRLGGVQLDGLVKHQTFDLVVRSDRPLSGAARHRISAIFDSANGMAGTGGQISFQSTTGRQIFDDEADPLHRHPNVTI